jgi:hypothetical protein
MLQTSTRRPGYRSTEPAADAPARSPPAVVQDLLCAFDGADGQYVRARVVTLEGRRHVAFALDAGRLDAALAEHVRLLLPIWCAWVVGFGAVRFVMVCVCVPHSCG